jgi:predicted amidohydrolase
MPKKKMRIGMGQLLVEGGEPERNLSRAEKMIAEAAQTRCDLVLLPEVLDLAWTHPSAKTEATPIPGPRSDRFCAAARKHGIWICAGLTERANDGIYNTAILVNSAGEIVLKYHKINLLTVEQPYYKVGQAIQVVDTPWGLIGVNICADNYFDAVDIGFVLARMGAQVILAPAAWTVDYNVIEGANPYGAKWLKPFSELATLFNCVVVGASCVGYIVGGPYEGKKLVGGSLCVGAKGVIASGRYNEFAGELIPAEFDVPVREKMGTEIGLVLQEKGWYRRGQ